jgi:hypothetical protein
MRLAAFGAVEDDPHDEVVRKVYEAVLHSRLNEQEISRCAPEKAERIAGRSRTAKLRRVLFNSFLLSEDSGV